MSWQKEVRSFSVLVWDHGAGHNGYGNRANSDNVAVVGRYSANETGVRTKARFAWDD